MKTLAPVVLSGWGVRLEPLALEHCRALQVAVADGDIGDLNYVAAPKPEDMATWIEHAFTMANSGRELPFVIVDDGRVVGTTRLYDIDLAVPTMAIGFTFLAASVWRTHVNTANKFLLMRHAFNTLGAQSLYFHTSHLNLRSQAAIERLGAHRDGILRAHKRHKDGSLRDTVVYSITAVEWPAVREKLDARLARG